MTADQRIHELIIRSRLSALWVFVLINMLLQDLHELLRAGQLEEMISGVVNGTRVTEELLLLAGIVLEVPIAMVGAIISGGGPRSRRLLLHGHEDHRAGGHRLVLVAVARTRRRPSSADEAASSSGTQRDVSSVRFAPHKYALNPALIRSRF
jgi:hypothetical protein